jgi:SPP1 family predicted phage head-tail adaptor
MKSGLLKERIEIRTQSTTTDSYGQVLPVHTTTATVWARVEVLGSQEQATQNGVKVITRYRITIRHLAIEPTASIVWRGNVLNLTGEPLPDETREYMVIFASSSGVMTTSSSSSSSSSRSSSSSSSSRSSSSSSSSGGG